jgi:hypothetical protein
MIIRLILQLLRSQPPSGPPLLLGHRRCGLRLDALDSAAAHQPCDAAPCPIAPQQRTAGSLAAPAGGALRSCTSHVAAWLQLRRQSSSRGAGRGRRADHRQHV